MCGQELREGLRKERWSIKGNTERERNDGFNLD